MPYRWFRCLTCGRLRQRSPNTRFCNAPAVDDHRYPCSGRLVRCDPSAESAPGSPAWRERLALQHLLVKG